MNAMYTDTVKRLQIYLQEDLDEALASLAVREGTSKAALIRRFVAERIGQQPVTDPMDRLIGAYDEAPGSIDALVYES